MCNILDINPKLKAAKIDQTDKTDKHRQIEMILIREKSATLLEATADSLLKGYSALAAIKVMEVVTTDLKRLIKES